MVCIKFKHSKPAGRSGFQPWHCSPLALMKVIADKAGPEPSLKDREDDLSLASFGLVMKLNT